MKYISYLIGILILLIGCNNVNSPIQPTLGEEFQAQFGKEILIPDEGIIVQFTDLIEDSRCPEGAVCVWAGNAKIAIQLNDEEAQLNTYLDPREKSLSGYNIELISVDPSRKAGIDIPKNKYTANIVITKE